MDENLLISFLGELKTEAEYTAQQIAFTVNSEGKTIYYVLTRVLGDNGTAREIMRIVTPNATGTAYVATNMALLSMEVPTALAFIGPALGVAVGAGVLSQTEPFQNVGTKIGESLYCFLNSDGQILFPEETIQAYAEKFEEIGAFEVKVSNEFDLFKSHGYPENFNVTSGAIVIGNGVYQGDPDLKWIIKTGAPATMSNSPIPGASSNWYLFPASQAPFSAEIKGYEIIDGEVQLEPKYEFTNTFDTVTTVIVDDISYSLYTGEIQIASVTSILSQTPTAINDYSEITQVGNIPIDVGWKFLTAYGDVTIPEIQPDSVTPKIPIEFPTTYPSWTPIKVYPDTGDEQTTYPISVPSTIPSTITTPQPEYQTPQPLLDPTADPRTTQISQLIGDLVLPTPTPIPSPTPQPSPDPDPSPVVNPDPPLDPTQPVEPNPPSANTDPDPTTPTITDPSLISAAGKLFTVYNPSSTGLNDLGAYLWSTNIIDIVKSIWQNPMDGIISYFVLYATPEANRTSTIYLGALDSGVSSPVVTNQFIDIDCGEVQIKEKWNNIGDYPPYTSIKLFLPFVGFVDINPDDVMGRDDGGGYIKVTYRVDVYTGTCLAQVWVRRAADMANYQILYTYNGNCAQQIPLTGATYQGLMQTLVGFAPALASVAAGPAGLTAAGGLAMSGLANSVGHQQVQMQRSGNMSANAGVLGQRKPYLIISRNNVYYATNFAEYYGYPAHATVVLGNMSGYVRVRDIHLEVPATSEELDEIEALLKEGVWF